MANYAVVFDHEGGKIISKDNKIAVFNRAGDAIFSHSTRSLGNSIKGACAAILSDWQANAQLNTSQPPPPNGASPENTDPGPGESSIPFLGIVVGTSEQGGGAEILEIDPDGVAALAGLKIGDIINSVDGKRVRSMPALAAALGNRQLGSILHIGYMFRNPSFGLMQGVDKMVTLNKQ